MTTGFPNSPFEGTYLKDDFVTDSAVGLIPVEIERITDAFKVGELDWEKVPIGVASTFTNVAGQNGILRITTANDADGDGTALVLHPDSVTLAGSNQQIRFKVRIPTVSGNVLAGNNFRIGLFDSVTATEPTVGIWVDSNSGVIELDAASTNGDKNTAASLVAFTSKTTMVIDVWYTFDIQMSGINVNGGPRVVKLYIDGTLAAQVDNFLLGSAEVMAPMILHWQDTGSADTLELDIDFVEYWLPRN